MKHFLLFSLLIVVIQASDICEELFPDVLSARTAIDVQRKVHLYDNDHSLQTPVIKGKATIRCPHRLCKASGVAPVRSMPFTFLSSSLENIVEVTRSIVFDELEAPDIVITEPDVTLTFIAPLTPDSPDPIQRIGTITDETGSATLLFEAGDYHIKALKIEAQRSAGHHRKESFSIKPIGPTRLFIDQGLIVSQLREKPQSLHINTRKKTLSVSKKFLGLIPHGMRQRSVAADAKDMLIYSKGVIDIDIKGSFQASAYIYSFEDISLNSSAASAFSGAIHSVKKIHLGKRSASSGSIGRFEYRSPIGLYSLAQCRALPDIPDQNVNDQTLLGIDSNRDGVRDDVELYIHERFADNSEHSQAKVAIAMQFAKAAQKTLIDPEHAYENRTDVAMDDAIDCNWYWMLKEKIPYEEGDILDHELDDKIFNTRQRLIEYAKYNGALGGHAYTIPIESSSDSCRFDLDVFGR